MFRTLLKLNGALKEFDEQFKKEEPNHSLEQFLKLAKLINVPRDYLGSTIRWLNTPSGYHYWDHLHSEWQNKCLTIPK